MSQIVALWQPIINYIKGNEQLQTVIVLVVFGFLFILPYIVLILRNFSRLRSASRKTGPITRTPVIPEWLGETTSFRVTSTFCQQARIECRVDADNMTNKTPFLSVNSMFMANVWMNSILADEYGRIKRGWFGIYRELDDSLPHDTCVISVPMKNFKCGNKCTEFEPVFGMAGGSYLAYQMCGDDAIQITFYVSQGVAHVAGYCVYIEHPSDSCFKFNWQHIRDCYAIPRRPLIHSPPDGQIEAGAVISNEIVAPLSSYDVFRI